jgi:hypothetical protein
MPVSYMDAGQAEEIAARNSAIAQCDPSLGQSAGRVGGPAAAGLSVAVRQRG